MFGHIHRILSPKPRPCCVCLLLLLLAAGGLPAQAQAPVNPEIARLTADAEKRNAAAQLQLGMRAYEIGSRKRPPDYAEALKWFRLAADQGNAQAEDRMGMMNLIFRFMAIVGLALDGLAVWYVVYLWQLFFKSPRPSQPLQQPVPGSPLVRRQA